jgi:DNA-binding MarR family transcriptional regulator
MLVLGLGLGLVMQVLVLIVQNEIDYADLGVATSGVTLFRLIGGSLGTALMGAIFANQLSSNLSDSLPPGSSAGGISENLSPAELQQLPEAVRDGFLGAYSDAIGQVFLIAAAIMAVAFLLSWLLQEHPLRQTMPDTTIGDSFAMPTADDSLAVIARGLATLGRRDVQRQFLVESLRAASVDLSPGAAWLLARLDENPRSDFDALATMAGVERERMAMMLDELRDKGMVERAATADVPPAITLTATGKDTVLRVRTAVRHRLTDRLAGWSPENYQELGKLLDRLTRDVVTDPVEVKPAAAA